MAVVARRYAEALINTAVEANAVSKFEEELDTLVALLNASEVKNILEFPGISVDKKKEFVNSILSKFEKSIRNLVLLVLDHGRLKHMAEIVAEYKEMADKHKDILHVEILSAAELESSQVDKIKEKVGKQYASNNVRVKTLVDPSLIGGVMLKIGDTVVDGTIKARLEGMERLLKQSSL